MHLRSAPAIGAALATIASVASAQAHVGGDAANWSHWALNCQGCHRPDGSGTPGGAPPMPGTVASFVRVDGGRQYLTRVPGVATAPLNDAELAGVLNFALRRFDGANLPKDFKPFTPEEIAAGRRMPLRTDAAATRRQLIERLSARSHE